MVESPTIEGTKSSIEQPEVTGIKPLQSISFSEKMKNDCMWGKENIRHFIDSANFNTTEGNHLYSVQTWYNTYNNQLDEKQYSFVTNPYSTTNDLYKAFPAKIRVYNILRPSIDLLSGEYSKRSFRFDVVNTDGDGVYNAFLAEREQAFKKNLAQRFVNESTKYQEGGEGDKNLPDPATLIDDLNTSYKDELAIKGYKALKLLEYEQKIKEKLKDGFKDWLIAGEVFTRKLARRGGIDYARLSPIWVCNDKASVTKNGEDGDWAVAKFRPTVADLVDWFYEEFQEVHLKKIEEDENAYKRRLTYTFTDNTTPSQSHNKDRVNKANLYYVCWKSRKKIGFLNYTDPVTLKPLTMIVDEDYPVDKDAGETVVWWWVNEVWEGWQINDDVFIGIKPITAQRNELNNYSACKLPINSRRFSDTESSNVSIMALGMTYQVMYTITQYRIELAIAKNIGKILLIDQNVIPSGELGQDKFLYYTAAMGYGFVDFSQEGVTPTVNTKWQILDASTYEDIGHLIKIAQSYKDAWEELLGINRQRKGETNATDGLGVTQEAVFRSSIVSDIIFSSFDEFVESELQGLLDLTKFAWIDGKQGYYRNDDGRMELFSMEPAEIANASLGVFVDSTGRTSEKFKLLQGQVNALAQRKDLPASMILDITMTDSYAELKAKIKKSEVFQAQMAKNAQAAENEMKMQLANLEKDMISFKAELDDISEAKKADRVDNQIYIQGEVDMAVAGAKTTGETTIDLGGIQEAADKRLTDLNKHSIEREKIASNERIAKMKDKTEKEKIAASLKNKVVGEK